MMPVKPTPFALTVVVLLASVVSATFLVAIKAMPPDTLEKMLLLIVGGALGAMNAQPHGQSGQPAAIRQVVGGSFPPPGGPGGSVGSGK